MFSNKNDFFYMQIKWLSISIVTGMLSCQRVMIECEFASLVACSFVRWPNMKHNPSVMASSVAKAKLGEFRIVNIIAESIEYK